MRITNQYLWNLFFLLFFIGLIVFATLVLEGRARISYEALTFVDFALIALASWRVTRLVVYDKIFAFFREQFYDTIGDDDEVVLLKPKKGPRRTLADLLSCPWCFGVWAGATVTFFYLLTPYAIFPVLFLALSAIASFFQVLSNFVGWSAEKMKSEVEDK